MPGSLHAGDGCSASRMASAFVTRGDGKGIAAERFLYSAKDYASPEARHLFVPIFCAAFYPSYRRICLKALRRGEFILASAWGGVLCADTRGCLSSRAAHRPKPPIEGLSRQACRRVRYDRYQKRKEN